MDLLTLPAFRRAVSTLDGGAFAAHPAPVGPHQWGSKGLGLAQVGSLDAGTAEAVCRLVEQLERAGLPPTCAWGSPLLHQYAAWATAQAREVTGHDWKILPAVECWSTPRGSRGWRLHRDRPAFVFDKHGDPILLTFWAAARGGGMGTGGVRVIPCSAETPVDGELMRHTDPSHGLWTAPLGIYAWNHGVIHEGTATTEGPRVAFAVELVRADHAGTAAWSPGEDVDWVGLILYNLTRYERLRSTPSAPEVLQLAQLWRRFHQKVGTELGGTFDDEDWVRRLPAAAADHIFGIRCRMRGPVPLLVTR